jgi:sRNA-binding carbon storage regulator CsrA
MLVLTVREGEKPVLISGEAGGLPVEAIEIHVIEIHVIEIKGTKVRLGFVAPKSVSIVRGSLVRAGN